MLKIRHFEKGVDELVWITVLNAAFKNFKDWRTISVEEFVSEEESSNFDFEGRMIAELDGKPVGVIHAHVDKSGEEEKGFLQDFGVIPEFRDLGVEEKLVESAVDELEKHGITVVQAPRIRWSHQGKEECIQFLEKMGFELIRRISLMEIDLAEIPSNIGENRDVVFRVLREGAEEDVELLCWLRNQCFKGQFNYCLTTVEENRYFMSNNSYSLLEVFFAILDEEEVGFLVVVIDEKFNIEKKARFGGIIAVGVLQPYRRKGIGTKLTLMGLEALKEKGMAKVILDVDDLNQTRAKRLYEKVGFEVVEQYLTYEKRLEP